MFDLRVIQNITPKPNLRTCCECPKHPNNVAQRMKWYRPNGKIKNVTFVQDISPVSWVVILRSCKGMELI